MGTVKVFEAARNCSNLKAILNITSDKCYENDGRLNGYKEQDPMGGMILIVVVKDVQNY